MHPTLDGSLYDDILQLFHDFGKQMERLRATYEGKDQQAAVEKAGGFVVGQYKEPLGGHRTLLSILLIDKIVIIVTLIGPFIACS